MLIQGKDVTELQPPVLLTVVETLKRETQTDFGPKDFFKMASNLLQASEPPKRAFWIAGLPVGQYSPSGPLL